MQKSTRTIFAILLLSAVLRLYGLSSESLWLDEGYPARQATDSFAALIVEFSYQTETPLHAIIIKLWCAVFGTSEFSLRFPSAAFGIAAVFGIFLLARELFSVNAGLLSALFLAVNPFAIHYSQEARTYALFLFGAVFSFYFILKILQDFKWPTIFSYLFFTAIAMYSHPLGSLVLVVHGAAFFIFRRSEIYVAATAKPFAVLGMMSASVVIYVPQLLLLWKTILGKIEGTSHASWIPVPPPGAFVWTVHEYFMSPFLAIAITAVMVLGIILGIITRNNARRGLLLPISIIGACLIVPWLISYVITPLFVARYTIPALIAFIILAAFALSKMPALLRITVLGILLTLTTHTLYGYYTGLDKAPWRETVEFVQEHANAGDVVVLNASYTKDVFNYYFQPNGEIGIVAAWTLNEIPAFLDSANRIWLIQAYEFGALQNVTRELHKRISKNRIAGKPVKMHGWAEPNPLAFWIADIQVTRFETKDNGIN